MALLTLDLKEFERLQQAMVKFQGDTEGVINDVLHNKAGQLIHDEIKNLMPVSDEKKKWKGKKPHAKTSNSLKIESGNLSVTVKTTKNYQYLYFADDGTNTRHHAGNLQFFQQGAETKQETIVDLCIKRLGEDFENKMN